MQGDVIGGAFGGVNYYSPLQQESKGPATKGEQIRERSLAGTPRELKGGKTRQA